MQINVFSLLGMQGVYPSLAERKKHTELSSPRESSEDTISISEEARTMLAKMTKPMTGPQGTVAPVEHESLGAEAESPSEESVGQGGIAKGIGEFGTVEEKSVANIEGRLKKLCEQYAALMESSLPEVMKQTQGEKIQEEIQDLLSQLKQAKEKAKQATDTKKANPTA